MKIQWLVGRLLSPIWVPLVAASLRIAGRYRIEGAGAARAAYRELRRRQRGPLLICANHLTLVDSGIIAWALGSSWDHVCDYASLPWNVPERRNFAVGPVSKTLTYVMKCRPVTRGGDRLEVAEVMGDIAWLLSRGEVCLVFPEGGRSRTGRVDTEVAAAGVGRIVTAVPGCKVLCVYVRGDLQEAYSDYPALGDSFRVSLRMLEPKTDLKGLRGSRELSRQIVNSLAEMEEIHFAERTRVTGPGRVLS